MKRTEQLDNDKEVLLFDTPNGPIWTTKGNLRRSPAEREQLAANLKAAQKLGAVGGVIKGIKLVVDAWLNSVFEELAPASVLNRPTPEEVQAAMGEWIVAEGYSFHRDGLTWLVKRQGTVVVELPIHIDASIRDEVLFMMKMEEAAAT